jgi:hypothetical protein
MHTVAKPGQLINDGDFYVCRTRVPGRVFDEKGRKLDGLEALRYPGILYTDSPSPPFYDGVRNWLAGPRSAVYTLNKPDKGRAERWEANYAANAAMIRRMADDVPPSDVVYLVASGPSLERNGPALLDIRRGVKVAVNWTLNWSAQTGYPVSLFDYFMCVDFALKPEGWADFPDVTGVFDVLINPPVAEKAWKDRLWFCSAAQGENPTALKARVEHPTLPEYDTGLNVTYCALQWACLALKARTVVVVGADCALTWGRYHCGSWAKYDDWKPVEFIVMRDNYGVPVVSLEHLVAIADWTGGAFYWMQKAGIRVINATEGGILSQFCEIKKLREAVEELNAAEHEDLSARPLAGEGPNGPIVAGTLAVAP